MGGAEAVAVGGDTAVSSLTAFYRSTPGAIEKTFRQVWDIVCQCIRSISDRRDLERKTGG